MVSKFDAYIPFVKEFVVPYLFWFAYMFISFIYLGLVSKKDYYRLCIYMFGGMAICYIIYMFFPTIQHLRQPITGTDIFSRAIQHIYSTDTPTNVAPSIHVFNSIAVHVAISHCDVLKKKRLLQWGSFISMLAISASTVLIKQHSIKDVMWGIILAGILYGFIYYLPRLLAARSILRTRTQEATVK